MKKYSYKNSGKFMNAEPCKSWSHTPLNGKQYKQCNNCAGCLGLKAKLDAAEKKLAKGNQ